MRIVGAIIGILVVFVAMIFILGGDLNVYPRTDYINVTGDVENLESELLYFHNDHNLDASLYDLEEETELFHQENVFMGAGAQDLTRLDGNIYIVNGAFTDTPLPLQVLQYDEDLQTFTPVVDQDNHVMNRQYGFISHDNARIYFNGISGEERKVFAYDPIAEELEELTSYTNSVTPYSRGNIRGLTVGGGYIFYAYGIGGVTPRIVRYDLATGEEEETILPSNVRIGTLKYRDGYIYYGDGNNDIHKRTTDLEPVVKYTQSSELERWGLYMNDNYLFAVIDGEIEVFDTDLRPVTVIGGVGRPRMYVDNELLYFAFDGQLVTHHSQTFEFVCSYNHYIDADEPMSVYAFYELEFEPEYKYELERHPLDIQRVTINGTETEYYTQTENGFILDMEEVGLQPGQVITIDYTYEGGYGVADTFISSLLPYILIFAVLGTLYWAVFGKTK